MSRARWLAVAALATAALGGGAWQVHHARLEAEKAALLSRIEAERQASELKAQRAATEAQQLEAERKALEKRLEELSGDTVPEPPEGTRVELSPDPAQPRATREAAALDLLAGRQPVPSFPLQASEPDRAFDYSLRDLLVPERVIASPAPPNNCKCEPGDPLCSCY